MKRLAVLAGLLALALVPAASAAPTGRLLVLLHQPGGGTARAAAAAQAVIAPRRGARRAGSRVPQLGLVTVAPRAGRARSPRSRSACARPARRIRPARAPLHACATSPNDPALTTPETSGAPRNGTVVEWWAAREHLPGRVGPRPRRRRARRDHRHRRRRRPPRARRRIVGTADFDDDPGDGPPTTDEVGHGTHVASLACATAGQRHRARRRRPRLPPADRQVRPHRDSSVASAIV